MAHQITFTTKQIINGENSPMQNRHIIFGVILCALAFLPGVQAVNPAPDGCYPNFTTAEGCNALKSLTTGAANTGVGWYSLFSTTTGTANTGVGAGALALNNTENNTAVGGGALFLNTTGAENTAVGANALVHNDSGSDNNAFGTNALFGNVEGTFNNAHGRNALVGNTASENNAFGDLAMENNTSGSSNTAIGDDALRNNVDGSGNVAIGDEAGTGLGPSVNNCIASGALGDGPFATLITPASSATSSERRLAIPALRSKYMSINITWWASSTHPDASNTTFNRWARPAKRCTSSSR